MEYLQREGRIPEIIIKEHVLNWGRKVTGGNSDVDDMLNNITRTTLKTYWEVRMDSDLEQMNREELILGVKKLREGIRKHRDSTGHKLCWYHPDLWCLLPEKTDPLPSVPEWPQFMEGCVRYRQSLDIQAPNAPRTNESYEE